ncbi:hypothetical protein F2P79_004663 [Pimephales promelas]|nr:hypothetical protein F2P79_004663 [Pimephales promelas]
MEGDKEIVLSAEQQVEVIRRQSVIFVPGHWMHNDVNGLMGKSPRLFSDDQLFCSGWIIDLAWLPLLSS